MITLPFPARDNKVPLPVSWNDACAPEHRTACNDMSTAILPALTSSAWMPQITGALPPLNWFTAACVSTNEGGSQLIGGSAIGIVYTPNIQINSWWVSLVQPFNVTGPAGLHFGLLCQAPIILLSNCSIPRDRLGGMQCMNSSVRL